MWRVPKRLLVKESWDKECHTMLVFRGIPTTPFLAARVESSYRHVLVMLGQWWNHEERASDDTFLKHTAPLLVVLVVR